ncbi:MAG TPA: shikimate dehydrogenase [Rubricoccaceae bacterium]
MAPAPTRLAALLGDPVAHSVSPALHVAAFAAAGLDAVYVACHVEAAAFQAAVDGLWALGTLGANVTVPHKVAALHAAASASDEARAIGAANTLVRTDGGWRAENTDVVGFLAGIEPARFTGLPAVVLGAGGAARAVVYALLTAVRPSHVTVATRDPVRARALAADARAWGGPVDGVGLADAPVQGAALVVNATPVGTGDPHATPWPNADDFGPHQTIYDLVYRPAETRLLAEARRRGATTIGGLGMLVAQAAASFRLWTGLDMDTGAATRAAQAALRLSEPPRHSGPYSPDP